MKKIVLVVALLPALAFADGAAVSVMKQKNKSLEMNADTCVINARTAFVKLRTGSDTSEDQRELDKCIADGKDSTKAAQNEIKATFKKKKVPSELAEWRLEWMAAFDATALKTGETEGQYLRRAQEARSKVERATNKFEIAME